MVFYGEYLVSFTGKGRIVIPKKIRKLIKGNLFILTKGFGFYLSGYNKEDWERRSKEFLSSSLLDQDNLDKKRFLFSSTSYLEIDKQGRFIIPSNLMKHAGLTSKAVIIGVGDHFEIWSPKLWEKYKIRQSL